MKLYILFETINENDRDEQDIVMGVFTSEWNAQNAMGLHEAQLKEEDGENYFPATWFVREMEADKPVWEGTSK